MRRGFLPCTERSSERQPAVSVEPTERSGRRQPAVSICQYRTVPWFACVVKNASQRENHGGLTPAAHAQDHLILLRRRSLIFPFALRRFELLRFALGEDFFICFQCLDRSGEVRIADDPQRLHQFLAV